MNLAKQDDGTSFFDIFNAASTGVGVGYWQFKKTKQSGVNRFTPTLDSRANILARIQSIDVDNAYSRAIKRFGLEHALGKVTTYQNKIELLNKLNRASFVNNINDIRGQLQEHVMGHGKMGPNHMSHSPVLKMSDKTFESLKGNNLLKSNQSLVASEWEAAVKSTFPNPLEAKVFASGDNSFESIKASLRSNPSTLMQRAFYTFEQNMDRLLALGHTETLGLHDVSSFIKGTPSVGIAKEVGLGGIQDVRLRNTIEQIQTALDQSLTVSRRGIEGLVGQGELQFALPGAKNPLFTIPETFAASQGGVSGLIRTGTGLHNVYAPGIFGIMGDQGIAERLTYSQLKSQQILDTILSQKLSGDTPGLQRHLAAVEDRMSKLADYMEPNISGQALSLETVFKGNQITVLDKQAKAVRGDARRHVAQALYGEGATPAGSGSRFALMSEEELYGPFASRQDYARKPWQFIRQHAPTLEAQEAIRANPLSTSNFDFLDSPLAIKTFNGPAGARAKTLYLSQDQIYNLSEMGHKIEDGELLLHDSMRKQLQVSRMRRINLQEIDTQVAKLMTQQGGVTFQNLQQQFNLPSIPFKGVLGRSPEGSVLMTRHNTELMGISPTLTKRIDQTTNAGLDLLVKETISMSSSEKVFGGLKGMARFGITPSFLESVASVTGKDISELQDITGFARAVDIKDPARELSALLSNFMLEAETAGVQVNSQDLVNKIKTMSTIEAEQFLGQEAQGLGFSTSLSLANKTGGVGVSQLYFGGEKLLSGAGNLSTVEPRLFTMLNAANLGGMGSEFTDEILERLIRSNPEKMVMHEELMKTLGSLEGTVKPTEGSMIVPLDELTNKTKMDELRRRGGFVATGMENAPHMYMPGYETVPQLHPRMVGTGAVVDTSQPGKIFRNVISDIVATHKGKLSETELHERFAGPQGHLTQLWQETAVAGEGAGSLARGRLPGSRSGVLLSTSENIPFEAMKAEFNLPENVSTRIAGVPRHFVEPMLEEMEKLHGVEAIAPMRKRFEAGELVAGGGWRHPIIDPYSAQPVLMKMIDTNEDTIFMSEVMKPIQTSEGLSFINSGPFAGWGADKDIDNANLMLLSPGMEEKLRAQMLNEKSVLATQMQEYQNHSIRMQLLKPKGRKGLDEGISLAEMRAAEATKLAIPSEEVGRLSTQLTKAHVALGASNLEQARKLRASSLLTWLEQTPISGKHLGARQATSGLFEEQMTAIRKGVAGNAPLLEGTISSMIETLPPDIKQLFGEGGNIEGIGPVAGWKISETTQDIARTSQEFDALPPGSQLAAATKYATPSRSASIGFEQLAAVRMANEIRPTSVVSEGVRGAIASINRELGSAVQKARPFIKPLALGALAAGATMAIMGGGPSSMPPPEERRSSSAPGGNTTLTNPTRDDIEIPGITKQILGDPSTRPQMQPQAIQLDQTGSDRRKGFHATIRANGITPAQRQSLVNRVNGRYPGSQINVNLQDNRKTLNPHSISDMIDK